MASSTPKSKKHTYFCQDGSGDKLVMLVPLGWEAPPDLALQISSNRGSGLEYFIHEGRDLTAEEEARTVEEG